MFVCTYVLTLNTVIINFFFSGPEEFQLGIIGEKGCYSIWVSLTFCRAIAWPKKSSMFSKQSSTMA